MGPGREEYVMLSSAIILAGIPASVDDKIAVKKAVDRAKLLADRLNVPEDPYEERQRRDEARRQSERNTEPGKPIVPPA
jgi:hypothetical protein